MLDLIRTKLLQPAEEAVLRGDYGTALYNAYVANAVAIRFLRDEEAAIISHDLASLVSGLIEADFEAIAERRGLTVTPENRAALLQEHSPHYVKFRELLTQPIPEMPLRNEKSLEYINKILFKHENESLNYNLYKNLINKNKLYNKFKNFKKK